MRMAQVMATIAADFGSAPNRRTLRKYRPLIVAELSSEAVNGAVTSIHVRILESRDDLVDPFVCIDERLRKDGTLVPLSVDCMLGIDGEPDEARQPCQPLGRHLTSVMRSKSYLVRISMDSYPSGVTILAMALTSPISLMGLSTS